MKMRFVVSIFVGVTCTGCLGYTPGVCIETCDRIYGSSQCALQRPGLTSEESLKLCEEKCTRAFLTSGSAGAYDPYQQTPRSETPALENRGQATVWAECVESTSCEDLEYNYCAPIW